MAESNELARTLRLQTNRLKSYSLNLCVTAFMTALFTRFPSGGT